MSKKISRVFYALIDSTMGDTIRALVTVSCDCRMLVKASEFMHSDHPCGHDYLVVRSTDVGYFGSKFSPIAINGQFVKK